VLPAVGAAFGDGVRTALRAGDALASRTRMPAVGAAFGDGVRTALRAGDARASRTRMPAAPRRLRRRARLHGERWSFA